MHSKGLMFSRTAAELAAVRVKILKSPAQISHSCNLFSRRRKPL